ncbi:hypothetical protein [Neisseria musculi]|uniref:Lipoprotein n=1 Tax=Neisseria musculi TaxID=1815583 RepID=A0A7H1MC73_9NEIS|nr:putative lipoprotein [Neisseria musculi]
MTTLKILASILMPAMLAACAATTAGTPDPAGTESSKSPRSFRIIEDFSDAEV